jgi:hypothetical protein
MTAPRKSTKADHIPPDMEAEIMELAPVVGDRLMVRCARLEAILWLYHMQRATA